MEIYVVVGLDFDETHMIVAFTRRDMADREAQRLNAYPRPLGGVGKDGLMYEVRPLAWEEEAGHEFGG